MLDFKLSYILNGSKSIHYKSNEVYVPAKLKQAMESMNVDREEALENIV
jgi:hypothetical protein